MHQRGLKVKETLYHVVADFNQYSKDSGGIASIAARFRGRCGVRGGRGRRSGTGGRCRLCVIGYVVVVFRGLVVGVVLFGLVIVDDGRIRNVGNGFVILVNGGVLRIDIGQVGAVVLVDVAVPCVVINGDVGLVLKL